MDRFDCLLAILQLCLFDPQNIALEGDLAWQVNGGVTYTVRGEPYDGSLGRLQLIVGVPITDALTLRYGLEHRSYFETDRDGGAEFVTLGFVWKPFR